MKKRTRAETKKINKQKDIDKLMIKYGLIRGDAEFWLDNGVPFQVRMDPAFSILKPNRKRPYKLSTDEVLTRAMKKRDEDWKENQKRQKIRKEANKWDQKGVANV